MITCLEFEQTKKGQPRKTARKAYEKRDYVTTKRNYKSLKKMGKGIEEKMVWYIYGKFGHPRIYGVAGRESTDKKTLKLKIKRDMAKFKITKNQRAFDRMFESYWLGHLFGEQHTDIVKRLGLPTDTMHIGQKTRDEDILSRDIPRPNCKCVKYNKDGFCSKCYDYKRKKILLAGKQY